MPDILVIGSEERIADLEADENPVDTFPCLFAGTIDRETRTQLYAIVTRCFLEDAMQMESSVRSLDEDGPYVYQLEDHLIAAFTDVSEDDIEHLAELWSETGLENPPELFELADFIYQFIHFCQTVRNELDLHLYVISDA